MGTVAVTRCGQRVRSEDPPVRSPAVEKKWWHLSQCCSRRQGMPFINGCFLEEGVCFFWIENNESKE